MHLEATSPPATPPGSSTASADWPTDPAAQDHDVADLRHFYVDRTGVLLTRAPGERAVHQRLDDLPVDARLAADLADAVLGHLTSAAEATP